jgi:sigma-B regulation protein RsbU (phosphoserine phosphatase)
LGTAKPAPYQILVVDDEPDVEFMVRQRFRKQIREREFEFYFSANGAEALNTLASHPSIDVVLTDINMPVMDGLTLLGKLKELSKTRRAVIVSAYGDMPNIRTAMNRGAADFLTKPIEFADMEATLRKTLDTVHQLKAAEAANARLSAMEHELGLAARIQQALLPATFPPFSGRGDFDLHAEMTPAKAVGGDLFDFSLFDDDHLAFVVGDVSGKGAPAAIFMAMTQTLLRGATRQRMSPGDCLDHVNQTLAAHNPRSMFVTVFYGILDLRTGELQYANGGHDAPYVVSAGGGCAALPSRERSLMVGIMEEAKYETERHTIQPGELLLAFTDGVTEAMNAQDEFFGSQRLEDCLRAHAAASAQELVGGVQAAVGEFAGGAPQADDITILALRYRG